MDELSKIRIPKGGLRVEIDDPDNSRIRKPAGLIRGWFATAESEFPEEFEFKIGGITLPHHLTRRSDVEAAMPEYNILGFNIAYDLLTLLPYISDNRLALQLILPGYDSLRLRFTVADSALASCLEAASGL